MAKKALCIVGGALMVVSMFLPVLFFNISGSGYGVSFSASVYYWMFGFGYAVASASYGGQTASMTSSNFDLDILGGICMAIIFVGAILAFALAGSDSKAALIGGLFGMLGMIIYIGGVYGGFMVPSWVTAAASAGYLVPFVGFYLCILGGILALIGGALSS